MTALGSIAADYAALTGGCGLVDRSERGKLALTGAGAKEFLQGQVSQDIVGLTPGHGAYAALLTNKGKMLADLRVLDAGAELLLDTERVALQELFNTIRRFSLGHDVVLHKRTLERGLLSLIGPDVDAVLARAALAVPGPGEHEHASGSLGSSEARSGSHTSVIAYTAIRTDLGADVLIGAEELEALRARLIGAGAVPVSDEAAEIVRIESGRPRYGIDLDDSVIPQEAGLNERAVSFTKGCYVGQETVARLYYKGKPNRTLQGLRLSAPVEPGTAFDYEGRTVAVLTSVCESPRLGPIGLALVRREAPLGSRLENASGVSAEVVALPFT